VAFVKLAKSVKNKVGQNVKCFDKIFFAYAHKKLFLRNKGHLVLILMWSNLNKFLCWDFVIGRCHTKFWFPVVITSRLEQLRDRRNF